MEPRKFTLEHDGPRKANDVIRPRPDGVPADAQRVHLYSFANVMRPRGGKLQKESVSASLLEHMRDAFNSWTDPNYGDSVSVIDAVNGIKKNLEDEVKIAIDQFIYEAFVQSAEVV